MYLSGVKRVGENVHFMGRGFGATSQKHKKKAKDLSTATRHGRSLKPMLRPQAKATATSRGQGHSLRGRQNYLNSRFDGANSVKINISNKYIK